jgi:hypothetical protein
MRSSHNAPAKGSLPITLPAISGTVTMAIIRDTLTRNRVKLAPRNGQERNRRGRQDRLLSTPLEHVQNYRQQQARNGDQKGKW